MKKTKILLSSTLLVPLATLGLSSCANTLTPSKKDAVSEVVDNIEYTIKDGAATVTKWANTKPTGTLTIPATVTIDANTYNVVAIGPNAFDGCMGITKVEIGANVTSIGDMAFNYCTKLVQADFSKCTSLTTIGTSAFRKCTSLKYSSDENIGLVLPQSITTIGKGAFRDCNSIALLNTTAALNNLTHIYDGAFDGCSSLSKIPAMNALQHIGASAFRNCKLLVGQTSSGNVIAIPTTVKFIGAYAFYGCDALAAKGISFSETTHWSRKGDSSNKAIYDTGAFAPVKDAVSDFSTWKASFAQENLYKYIPVTSLTITSSILKPQVWDNPILKLNCVPADATVASSLVIESTSANATIDENNKVTFLNDNCSATFQATVNDGGSIKVATHAFTVDKCPVEGISWDSTNPSAVFFNGSKQFTATVTIAAGADEKYKEVVWSLVDTDNTGSTISEDGLFVCGNKSGTVQVTAKSKYLASKTVTQPVTVGSTLKVENNVLKGFAAEALTQAEKDAGYPSIKTEFKQSSSKIVLKIPAGVTKIAWKAFDNGDASNPKMPNIFNDVDFSAAAETLTEIEGYAFGGWSNGTTRAQDPWTTLTLPKNVTKIGQSAFWGRNFETITLNESLTTLEVWVFSYNMNCKQITFSPDCPITNIPNGTFYWCTSLDTLTLPKNITIIADAFWTNNNLNKVIFTNSQTEWKDDSNNLYDVSNATAIAATLKQKGYGLTITKINPTPQGSVTYSVDTESGKATFSISTEQKKALTSLVVPAYIEVDGKQYPVELPSSISGCKALETIVLPGSITALPRSSYWCQGNSALKYINLSNLTYMPSNCFEDCTSLLEADLSSLEDQTSSYSAFKNCTSLEKVTFSPNVKFFAYAMFQGCSSLKEVDLSICTKLPDSGEAVRSYCFSGCTSLQTIKLPPNWHKLTVGGSYQQQFQGAGAAYKTAGGEGCYVEFPAGDTANFYVTGNEDNKDDNNAAFLNSYITKIRTDSASIYNAQNQLGGKDGNTGLLTNLKSILIPKGVTPDDTAYIRATLGFTLISPAGEGENYDTWGIA